MAVVTYSDKAVKALEPPSLPQRQTVYGVQGKRGLLLVVSSGGTKSWHYRYQLRGRRRTMKLGEYPELSLKAASDAAEDARADVRKKLDPHPRGGGDSVDTFGAMVDAFLAHHEEAGTLAPSTLREWKRILNPDPPPKERKKHVRKDLPPQSKAMKHLRTLPPAEITDVDVARVMDAYEQRKAHIMGNRVQGALAAVFTWAKARRRFGVRENPVRSLPRRHKEAPRERTLDLDEIRRVWNVLDAEDLRFRVALRLVLLSGQRPGEVYRMRWEHIEGSTWTMPQGYRKATKADNGRPAKAHRVHLSAPALAEVERIRGWERGGYVFPAKVEGKPKPIERHAPAHIVRRLVIRLEMPAWVPHDLRRSARTLWSDVLKVDPIVAEKLLGHALPTLLRTYDRGEQWEERVDALERWGAYVANLVTEDER